MTRRHSQRTFKLENEGGRVGFRSCVGVCTRAATPFWSSSLPAISTYPCQSSTLVLRPLSRLAVQLELCPLLCQGMPHTHPSLAPSATQKAAVYAASCNPPRKAKRIRVDNVASDVEATATTSASTQQLTTPPAQNVRIRPSPPSIAPARAISPPVLPAPSVESTAVGPKKRGRKPGAMSRSARETQRKINHSRIEKARRSKINDALDALRDLVPPDFGKEKEAEDGK